jgi:hypothetical protein
MEDGQKHFCFYGWIFLSFLGSCLLEVVALTTIDGYRKCYEKYQFTLIMDLPVVSEVEYVYRLTPAHRPSKSFMKD